MITALFIGTLGGFSIGLMLGCALGARRHWIEHVIVWMDSRDTSVVARRPIASLSAASRN